jgi:D-glycerate 3-kinase
MNTPPAVEHMVQHVLTHLNKHKNLPSNGQNTPPLIVGVQGPQGSGKTFLTAHVRNVLTAEPHNLAVTLLSIDDLYLPHHELVSLARSYPHNALLSGRGQPGTHDVALGTKVLNRLRKINESVAEDVVLPVFEKSLHGGEGDRLARGINVKGSIDVAIVEGWCTGFYPISSEEIDKRWSQQVQGLEGVFSLDMYRKEDIYEINERLRDYVNWWTLFDIFIQAGYFSDIV